MSPKQALDEIRALFAAPQAMPPAEAPKPEDQAPPTEMSTKEYVLENGTKVLISELEVGGMVAVMQEDGTSAPAPAGEHKLADGTVITVAENGVITAVSMPAQPAAPEEELAKFRDELAALRSENEQLRDRLASMGAAFDKHYAESADKMTKLAGILEGLLSVPSTEPVQAPKDKFEAQGPSQKEKFATLLATIDNMKKSK
jgi:hypothetical protein